MIITKDREIESWSQIDRSDLLSMNKINIDKIDQTLYLTEKITQGLSPEATLELFKSCGTEDDIDLVFDKIFDEAYRVMFGGLDGGNTPKIESVNLGYLEKLSASVEEELRCNSLSYFITSLLPDFDMGWHHLDWARIPGMFKKFLILAARDHGKCLYKGTKVRMYNGTLKKVEDIKVGDLVMGFDSKPRKVLSTHNGYGKLYKVKQTRGMDYVVNSKHTLTLQRGKNKNLLDIDIEDFIDKCESINSYRSKTKGVRFGFELKENKKLLIEPYFLGLWLGDGNKNSPSIATLDIEVIDYIKEYANRLGLSYNCDTWFEEYNNYVNHHICIRNADLLAGKTKKDRNRVGKNTLLNHLRYYNVYKNKHIPKEFLLSSRRQRLELLAGLIDSDGSFYEGMYYFCNKDRNIIDGVKELCYTLGFSCGEHKIGKDGCINLGISGDNISEIPVKIARKKKTASTKRDRQCSLLTIEDFGKGRYYGFSLDDDQRFLLEDGTITHNSYMFSNAYPCWQLYRYKPKTAKERTNNRGFLFSFSVTQAIDLLEILKDTIVNNDILRDRLYNKDRWSKLDITCKNRARFTVKGFGSAVRGAHPYWIMIDDGLKDNVLYSSEQNQKTIDYFHAVIENLLIPGGSLGLVGTPFRVNDLYGHLKLNGWPTFEYPAIFPDGTLLWPERWNYDGLMAKRKSQGNLIFSRELLVKPVTSDSTIFPIEILNTAFHRMDMYTLVHNIDSFPIKFKRVVTGCDFAISGSVGADYSTYLTWGIDEQDRMWLVNAFRAKGLSFHEQIANLKRINREFRPDVVAMEDNIFQTIFVQEADRAGLPVIGLTTGKNKNDLRSGLPSLAIMFERGMFRIPTGDQPSKDFADMLVLEFTSVAFTDKGLQGTSEHDDIAMGTYKSVEGARKLVVSTFDFHMV